jgi:hypothetical protein
VSFNDNADARHPDCLGAYLNSAGSGVNGSPGDSASLTDAAAGRKHKSQQIRQIVRLCLFVCVHGCNQAQPLGRRQGALRVPLTFRWSQLRDCPHGAKQPDGVGVNRLVVNG